MTMFKCFICQALHTTSKALISHLRIGHSFYPSTKFKLSCSQDACRRQFSTYAGLIKHLNTVHGNDFCHGDDAEEDGLFDNLQLEPDCLVSKNPIEGNEFLQGAGCSESNRSGQCSSDDTKNICAAIISKLTGSGVANSVVSSVVSHLEDFAEGLHSEFKHKVLSAIPADNPVRNTLGKCLETFENPVENFNTESKRKKYLSEKWGMVDPVEKLLGFRYDSRLNKVTGTFDQVPVKDTFVYVPILETIKFICRNTHICGLLSTPSVSSENRYEDFCDGSYFRSHPLFSEHQACIKSHCT